MEISLIMPCVLFSGNYFVRFRNLDSIIFIIKDLVYQNGLWEMWDSATYQKQVCFIILENMWESIFDCWENGERDMDIIIRELWKNNP